ncbi:54S ribosomal protein L2 mitochondrial [Scheffersomyces spartinae]|uniref:Large ribosomal subunit protein bL27m n=1 Tax=Scheffersomyces spartinae TaxID=45513 RepID=A0A9P7V4R1_9ASCO|nr:54S ribosomal protein L2 mitochondrial [Scheffersomyces spartinae]KAG7191269.1 54S ribosomal protein L2 mitochondrial [Scheffersomyces spartinae]
MSFYSSVSELLRPVTQFKFSSLVNVSQVRNATKRVSGSRTNKNDSAGRRLGPKAYENTFVKPGQIIMRQRGTKIHPGENVGIGIDHTIYALEPGYVKFYYNPFHPYRKYVGISLKKDLDLPTPHFEPRTRRFGYVELTGLDATKEETRMSRKEFLATPKLKALQEEESAFAHKTIEYFKEQLSEYKDTVEDENMGAERLFKIYQLVTVGQPLEQAQIQATFDYLWDLKLAHNGADISTQREKYLNFVEKFDNTVSVDFSNLQDAKLFAYITPQARSAKKQEITNKLETSYSNKVLKASEKSEVMNLIKSPGIFSQKEQTDLTDTFLPKVLPLDVPGSIIEDVDTKKPPKGVVITRVYDAETKTLKVVGRPKEVYSN